MAAEIHHPEVSFTSDAGTLPDSGSAGPAVDAINLDLDRRLSLVVPAASVIRFPVRVDAGSVLKYDIGWAEADGPPASSGSGFEVVFENRWDGEKTVLREIPSEDVTRQWTPDTVELADGKARSGFLELHNGSSRAVALANPVILAETPLETRPNIILVVVDTLRSDRLGCYGYGRDTSPFLDQLADKGVRFDRALSQSSWTKTSMPSLLTSTYPAQNGVRGVDDRLADEFQSIAELLAAEGYFTAAVQTNPWLVPDYGMDQGFMEYRVLEWNSDVVSTIQARPVNEIAIESLRRRTAEGLPFFLYLHYMDVHAPYLPRPEYRSFGDEPTDLYDSQIRLFDDQLRNLYESLEQLGVWRNTILVIASDHGEEFGEHGGHSHGRTLYDEVLHVPLIFSWEGKLPAGRTIDSVVRNLDIAPTLVDFAGLSPPSSFEGQSLSALIRGKESSREQDRPSFAQVGLNDAIPKKDLVSVTTRRWKYIYHRRANREELFDLAADPDETSDLAAQNSADAATLRNLAAEFVSIENQQPGATTAPMDARVEEQLRSLGYLQ